MREVVTADDVKRAEDERRYRLGHHEERYHERILRGKQFVQTSGEAVGQINGISVYDWDEFEFAEPCRITARSFVTRGGINDIDRNVNYTDNSHNKGIAIIESYLGGLYSLEQSLQLTANVAFEQSYNNHSGDSASVALLCAMLSAVGNIPIYQDIAITGTLDQFGNYARWVKSSGLIMAGGSGPSARPGVSHRVLSPWDPPPGDG